MPNSFPGQGIPLVHDIRVYLDIVRAACTNQVSIDFRINNNLKTYINIRALRGTASQTGTEYASFDYNWKGDFITNAGENPGPYSPEQVTPVALTKTFLGSLALLNTAPGLDLVSRPAVVLLQSANLFDTSGHCHGRQYRRLPREESSLPAEGSPVP